VVIGPSQRCTTRSSRKPRRSLQPCGRAATSLSARALRRRIGPSLGPCRHRVGEVGADTEQGYISWAASDLVSALPAFRLLVGCPRMDGPQGSALSARCRSAADGLHQNRSGEGTGPPIPGGPGVSLHTGFPEQHDNGGPCEWRACRC
jgi:hypothetical protein